MTNPNLQKLFCETFSTTPEYCQCGSLPLSLDLLFAVAKREGIEFRIEASEKGYGAFCGKFDWWERDPIDALVNVLLRFRGINVENL